MEYKLKAYTIWDCGKRVDAEGKPHQEDSIFPAHEQTTEKDRLFILCDGMGGHEAGEVASATVCGAMSKSILSAEPNAEGNFTDDTLFQALSDAYGALDDKDNNTSGRKMGTTMTLLKLHNKGCTIAHIGDSRVYHIRPGKTAKDTEILFRTEDHSLVNELVKAGELTPEEAKMSRQKNVITRAMQPHLQHRPKADVYHTVDICPNDYFYLCSDGMLENMEDHQLCYFFSEEAGDDPHKVSSLVKATQENSDNHSAIIVHIAEVLNPIKEVSTNTEKFATVPLKGEVHENNVLARGNKNQHITSEKKSSKWLVLLSLLPLICLVVVATIVFYPKPPQAQKAEPKEQWEEERDITIKKPIKPQPPLSTEKNGGDVPIKVLPTKETIPTSPKTNPSNIPITSSPTPGTNELPIVSETEGDSPVEQEEVVSTKEINEQYEKVKEQLHGDSKEERLNEETSDEPT